MTETRQFPIGAVLSVTTGRLVSENHISGVYSVLNWMSGVSLFTRQLPRVGREAAPVILAMHPHLAGAQAEAERVTEQNLGCWLRVWQRRYGETIAVPRLTRDQHERIDPLSELAEHVHPDRIITVEVKH